jgi:transcriptional regulator with XRE-family HTH domain
VAAIKKLPTNYGPELRAARKGAGLTLRALAKLMGCTHAHLSHIETGHQQPSPALLERLHRHFGLPASTLLRLKAALEPWRPRWRQVVACGVCLGLVGEEALGDE